MKTVLIRPTQADTARVTIAVLRELNLERLHDQFGNRRLIVMMLQNLTHMYSVNIHIIRLQVSATLDWLKESRLLPVNCCVALLYWAHVRTTITVDLERG